MSGLAKQTKKSWKTIQLPEDLVAQVDRLVRIPELGYTSRSEFIKEAVRLRIAEVEEYLARRTARRAGGSAHAERTRTSFS